MSKEPLRDVQGEIDRYKREPAETREWLRNRNYEVQMENYEYSTKLQNVADDLEANLEQIFKLICDSDDSWHKYEEKDSAHLETVLRIARDAVRHHTLGTPRLWNSQSIKEQNDDLDAIRDGYDQIEQDEMSARVEEGTP